MKNYLKLCILITLTTLQTIVLAYDIPKDYIGPVTVSTEETTATISWTTIGNATSQVLYGETDRYTTTTDWTRSATTEHSIILSDLSPNTEYHYKIRVYEEGLGDGVTAETSDLLFTTNSSSLSISDISTSSANSTTIGITFTTSVESQSIIEYGLTEAFGSTKTSDQTSTNHAFTLVSLLPSTTYYFRITAINEGSMTLSETLTFTTTEPGGVDTPPEQVTSIGIRTLSEDSVILEWTPSNDDVGIYAYVILYAAGTMVTQEMIDQDDPNLFSITLLTDSQCDPNSPSYTHTGLTPEITYYYRIVAIDTDGKISPLSASASTLINRSTSTQSSGCAAPMSIQENETYSPQPPKNVRAASLDKEIQLFWKNPSESNYLRTIVVRKKNDYPTHPKDGDVIYSGTHESFSDLKLENEKTYFYALFSEDYASNYSLPVTLSISPRGGITNIHVVTTLNSEDASVKLSISKTYKKGDSSEDIEHLQELLAAQPAIYPEGLTTGYFGGLTEQAVRRFQATNSLPQNGEFDKVTIDLLLASSKNKLITLSPFKIGAVSISRTLKRGIKGNDVRYLQEFLTSQHLLPENSVSGTFGPLTEQAVKNFQIKMNITPVSGIVGEKTRAQLQKIIETQTLESGLLSWLHIPEVAGWFSKED